MNREIKEDKKKLQIPRERNHNINTYEEKPSIRSTYSKENWPLSEILLEQSKPTEKSKLSLNSSNVRYTANSNAIRYSKGFTERTSASKNSTSNIRHHPRIRHNQIFFENMNGTESYSNFNKNKNKYFRAINLIFNSGSDENNIAKSLNIQTEYHSKKKPKLKNKYDFQRFLFTSSNQRKDNSPIIRLNMNCPKTEKIVMYKTNNYFFNDKNIGQSAGKTKFKKTEKIEKKFSSASKNLVIGKKKIRTTNTTNEKKAKTIEKTESESVEYLHKKNQKYKKLVKELEEKLNKSISLIPGFVKQIKHLQTSCNEEIRKNKERKEEYLALKKEKCNLNKIIDSLRNKKNQIQIQKESLIQSLLKDQEKREKSIEKIEGELHLKNETLDKYMQENEELNKELQRSKTFVFEKETKLFSLLSKYNQLNEKIDSLENENKTLVQRNKELLQILQTKENEKKDLLKTIEENQKVKNQLQSDYNNAVMDLLKSKNELETQLNEQKEKYENTIEQLKLKLNMNNYDYGNSLKQIEKNFEEKIKKLNQTFEEQKKIFVEEELEKIKTNYERKLNMKEEEMDELQKDMEYQFSLKEDEYKQRIQELMMNNN